MSEPNAAPHPDGAELPRDSHADEPDAEDVEPADAPEPPDEPTTSGDADDTDARFASIVAQLRSDPIWAEPASQAAPKTEPRFPTAPGVRPLGPRDHPATDDVVDLEDDQSHYEPPEPPPLLGGDPLLTLGWIAVLLAMLSLLATVFGPKPTPTLWLQVTGGVLLLGVTVLLWRMPHRRDLDHVPDDQV